MCDANLCFCYMHDDLMVAFIPNASHIKAMLSLIFFPFFFFSVEILSDMYIGWSILRSKWKYTSVKVLIHINGHAVLFYLLSRLYHGTFKSLLSVEKARILTITFIFSPNLSTTITNKILKISSDLKKLLRKLKFSSSVFEIHLNIKYKMYKKYIYISLFTTKYKCSYNQKQNKCQPPRLKK